MTDLEINVALAKAMGWVEIKEERDWFYLDEECFRVYDGEVQCSYGLFDGFQAFDYRDPVIFVAICKHWKLVVNFDGWVSGVFKTEVIGHWSKACIEQAAALTVIELEKRGIK